MRRVASICALISALALGDARAQAEEAPLTATLQCDRASEPGRVRCSVETRVGAGRTLQWADVVLIELPPFVQALKGRLGPSDSVSRDPTTERWAFGLVAKSAGEGEAKVRIRAIACEGTRCAPVMVEAKASVHVG
jgi:hypothetical protein